MALRDGQVLNKEPHTFPPGGCGAFSFVTCASKLSGTGHIKTRQTAERHVQVPAGQQGREKPMSGSQHHVERQQGWRVGYRRTRDCTSSSKEMCPRRPERPVFFVGTGTFVDIRCKDMRGVTTDKLCNKDETGRLRARTWQVMTESWQSPAPREGTLEPLIR